MITIKDYDKLQNYINAFSDKEFNLMIIVSKGGLGKTFMSEEALIHHGPLIFNGHVTPLGMYKQLLERNKEEKDFIVIFDDVDALMMNKSNVALLKQLCDTREEKTIKYHTTSPALKDIDSEFTTQCKVLMLMNDITTGDTNLNALLTRAHFLNFEPNNLEILKHMRTFSEDTEILDYIENHIAYSHLTKTLNLRVYKRATELKNAKLDWKEEILNELKIDGRLLEIEVLLKKYKTDIERAENFSKSRSTYFTYKNTLLRIKPELAKKYK